MDISHITDINQLKSLAYDQIAELERVKQNLSLLNKRIEEVINENSKIKKVEPKK